MPKADNPVNFDAGALCEAAHAVQLGLSVKTSNGDVFKRRMYEHMARHPSHRLRILSGQTENTFLLVKPLTPAQDEPANAES